MSVLAAAASASENRKHIFTLEKTILLEVCTVHRISPDSVSELCSQGVGLQLFGYVYRIRPCQRAKSGH